MPPGQQPGKRVGTAGRETFGRGPDAWSPVRFRRSPGQAEAEAAAAAAQAAAAARRAEQEAAARAKRSLTMGASQAREAMGRVALALV